MFIRNLTLKRHYNIKSHQVVDSFTSLSSVESTLLPETIDSPELSILKDLYNMDSDEDLDMLLLTQHLSTSPPIQYSKFRLKSVFNPTCSKRPYLQTFYQVVFSDMQKLCQHTHDSYSNHSNLTLPEKTALKHLTDNHNIVIKTAD